MKAVREKQKRGAKPALTTPTPAEPELPSTPPVWRKHALVILTLWTCALLAYSNSFNGAFVFDNSIILQDSRIKAVTPENIDLILTQEYWYNWSLTGLYRPLTTFSYLLNYTILGGGDHPPGYHWINLWLHAINIALVYLLGLVLLEDIWPAAAMAALWALHPVLTESVTNIVGRSDLLAAFGVLAGLLCHIRAAKAAGWRKAAWLLGLALVTTIGYFSKESTVVVLAAMLIYDLAYGGIQAWRSRVPGYVALLIPMAIYLYVRDQVISKIPAEQISFTDNPLYRSAFLTGRLTAIKVIGKYIWLLIWPGTLSVDYSYNQVPLFSWGLGWEDLKVWIALLACLASVAAAIWCYRRQRAVFFCVFFFFATLSPTANIVMHIGTIMAERFLYLPSIGYAGCLAVALWAIFRRLPLEWQHPRAAIAVAAVIAFCFLVRTYERNKDWLDADSFWTKAIETSPASFKTHMAYSTALNNPESEASVDRSIQESEKSLAILKPVPDYLQPSGTYINMGMFYRQKGILTKKKFADPAEGERQAEQWYRKSLVPLLRGKEIEAALNADKQREGRWHAGKVLEFGWWQLDIELGRTYLALKEPKKALAAFRNGLRRRPMPEFYVEIAEAWRALGDLRRSAVALMEGILIDPSHTAFTTGLVEIYKQIDPKSCAVQLAGGATNLNLACPMVHDDLCAGAHDAAAFYVSVNQRPKALQVANTAIQEMGCPADPFK
jgi:tetratricopeptide (TPR) repeat protein